MKQIKYNFLKGCACLLFLIPLSNNSQAQSYFAGTSAGTGNTGTNVTGVGAFCLSSSNSGTLNVALGYKAMSKNTSGNINTAIGSWSMFSNLIGFRNTAIGYNSLYTNTDGSGNTAVGNETLYLNKSGSSNTAIGFQALFSNLNAPCNTAIGAAALALNTSGQFNVATGVNSLLNNSTGSYNSAFGASSLYSNTGGSSNTAGGYQSLYSNQNGASNAAYGAYSLKTLTGGFRNTAIGYNSLNAATTTYDNTAIGNAALGNNTGGAFNTAVGSSALELGVNGSYNVAVGYQALQGNSGSYNTSVGHTSLLFNSTGGYNSALGFDALLLNTSGFYNTSNGAYALYANSTGSNNTASGYYALLHNKTGGYNVAFGENAGSAYTFLNGCSFIGNHADASRDSLTNATAIGYLATVDSSNKVVVGNTSVTSIGGQVGWTTYSDQRLKTNINKSKLGLDFILSLNPVTYNYKAAGQKDILYTGLIAQEVDAAAKKANIVFSGVDKNGSYWGIRYAELTVPLIKAMQELSEKETAKEIELQQRIEKLESVIAQLQNNNASKSVTATSDAQTILFQNQPNPFNQSTVINYQLKNSTDKAAIVIRNLNGTKLKEIAVNTTGKGQVTINANEFEAGTYTYTLVVNGTSVETKLMILIK